MQSDTTVASIAADFLIAVTIIIATQGQKTLHLLLSKVILSGMCNCNFEAINYNLGQNIWTKLEKPSKTGRVKKILILISGRQTER